MGRGGKTVARGVEACAGRWASADRPRVGVLSKPRLRSGAGADRRHAKGRPRLRRAEFLERGLLAEPGGAAEEHSLLGEGDRRRLAFAARPGRTGTRDRKSTRLNSSHGYISYAVFCLKKKKY